MFNKIYWLLLVFQFKLYTMRKELALYRTVVNLTLGLKYYIDVVQAVRKNISVLNGNYHQYIPSGENMMDMLLTLIEKENIGHKDVIVDAGCGISPILLTLRALGYTSVHGIEYNQYLVEAANKMFTFQDTILHADLLSKDKEMIKILKKAKLVYMFMPIRENKLYLKAAKNIWNYLPNGAIIVDFFGPLSQAIDKKHIIDAGQNGTGMHAIAFKK